jgi:sensor domain CHASE-containing protein
MTPASAKAAHYKNDLRRLTVLIGAALCVFGALLVAIVAYAGMTANSSAVIRERQLVENALDQSVSRVLDQQKAIAWWDDAVLAVSAAHPDTEWLETNFGIYFHETYGHDEIIIVDGENRPIYANVEGELTDAAQAYANRSGVLDEIVAEARRGADG